MLALAQQSNILDEVIHGEALAVLRTLPDNSIDACVVDPPYGLGEVKDIAGLLMAWMHDEDDKAHTGKSGFMGKEWDSGVPGPRYWKEVLRVLKPGAHILAFAGTRTYDLLVIALRLAGFEIRDQIDWLCGSGFPKSMDVSKQIDKHLKAEREVIDTIPNRWSGKGNVLDYSKREIKENAYITAPATPEAQRYAGFGTNLKPAHEPICLARKPLAESSIAANVLEWGTGAININATRVGYANQQDKEQALSGDAFKRKDTSDKKAWARPWMEDPDKVARINTEAKERAQQGRWPANLLLSHSVWCVPNGVKRVRTSSHSVGKNPKEYQRTNNIFAENGGKATPHDYLDSEGMEQVEDWLCDESCPVRLLDEQGGYRKSGANKPHINKTNSQSGFDKNTSYMVTSCNPANEGYVSRYFMRFYYCSKASRAERNRGCEGLPEKEGFDKNTSKQIAHINHATGATTYNEYHPSVNANSHPTVKPLALCRYLVRMITPPGGIVLDCFAGSGSTLVAAIYEGMHFIGIEQLDTPEEPYVTIARARIEQAFREVQS